MDDWGFEQLQPRLQAREAMPVGPLFCVINRRTCGRAWSTSAARAALRRRAARASVRRRFVPHQLRHAHAIGLARGACRSTSSNVSWATATWA
jgi:integrase